MAQEKYTFAGWTPPRQPSSVDFSLAVTSTEDSGNTQDGVMRNKVMFTKEAYKITFDKLYSADVAQILQKIVGKSSISFHYFSPYYGQWRTDKFYVANINGSIVSIKEGREGEKGLSFQITGINPL